MGLATSFTARRTVVGWISLLAVITSCEGGEQEPEEVLTASLTVARQFGDSLSWAFPYVSLVVGSQLVVSDRGADSYFTVVDLETGRLTTFGRKGAGPEEFKDVSALLPGEPGQRAVWAFDPANRRFSLVALDDSAPGRILEQFSYNPPEFIFYPVFVGDRVVGGGPLLDAVLIVTDRAGALISRTVVDPPFTEAQLGSPATVRMANSGHLAFRPGAGDIAMAYGFASRMDLFTPDGAHRETILPSARPVRTSYDVDASGVAHSDADNEKAYQSAHGTRRFIYAVFCGCTRQEYTDGLKPNVVQVWTWDGRLVATLTLDRPIVSLSVSEDDTRLFGLAWNPEPAVLEWVLPSELSGRGRD
jgi:hypothetical protein